jgi:hypothetical protein
MTRGTCEAEESDVHSCPTEWPYDCSLQLVTHRYRRSRRTT